MCENQGFIQVLLEIFDEFAKLSQKSINHFQFFRLVREFIDINFL